MRNKAIGILALILLAALIFGSVVGLPLWAWGVGIVFAVILFAIERAWTRLHSAPSTLGKSSDTDQG